MTDPNLIQQAVDPREPVQPVLSATLVKKPSRISWIWLIPIVAAIAGATLLVRNWMEQGPQIVITFDTAQGLEVGKTQVRYKEVVVGTVSHIELSDDWSQVNVTADISSHAEELASPGSRFWVVRPRLSFSGVSGLGTLLSGAYIEVDVQADALAGKLPRQTQFRGLEKPPEVATNQAGSHFVLEAKSLGSLDIGAPVYFRQIKVGQVVDYQLDNDGEDVDIQIFIDAPYDRFVTTDTRFWDASGIDLSLSAGGLTLRTQSLLSIALGGLAFESFGDSHTPRAENRSKFPLYASETTARAVPDNVVLPVQMRFDQSIRGLNVGATVDFKGLPLGTVTGITLHYDAEKLSFYAVVNADLYPRRLGSVYEQADTFARNTLHANNLFEPMIQHGLRAQLRTANLLTGQLYVVIDTFPNAEPVTVSEAEPFVIPTIAGDLDQLQQRLSNLLTRIEQFPIDKIGQNAQQLLQDTSRLMRGLDKQLAPEVRAMVRQGTEALAALESMTNSDSPLLANSDRALQELTRAARSLRTLAEFLQANPDALIRGR